MSTNQKYPIVLAHGIARFDILRELFVKKLGLPAGGLTDRLHYFKGIKTHLEANGFEVHHSSVDFAGSVDERAGQLSEQINKILEGREHLKVHIIAHSMGGLDARHLIVDIPGMADKVASLNTIGTPHLGTTLADFVINEKEGEELIKGLGNVIHLEGFRDLMTSTCVEFNRRAADMEATNSVVYRTFAGAEDQALTFLPLQHSWRIIEPHEGENDGLVSVKSQQWEKELIASDGTRKEIAQFKFSTPADHLNEVGWWDIEETSYTSALMKPLELLRSLLQNIKTIWSKLRGIAPDKINQKHNYEDKIKDVYLKIAQSL